METADNLTDALAPPLSRLLAQGIAALKPLLASARLDAEVLLAYVLGLPRSALIAHAEQRIEPMAAARYRALLARRAEGEPVAYLVGEREFWSLSVAVSSATLIPRPETELVVERALALLPETREDAAEVSVADLGTGSGAIALALAHARPGWRLLASDNCAAALQVARANAQRLGAHRIEFIEGDWFAPLAARRFHAILSNPPYVAAADPSLRALRYEPVSALSPGPTGLEALRHLIAMAPACLAPDAWLVLEHGADQACEVAAALVASGYARVRCHRDLAGRDRVSEAQWPH
jgi:release factor glutamine methyltransferase